MKFAFEIPDEEFEFYNEDDFKSEVKTRAVDSVVASILEADTRNEANDLVKIVIKEHKKEIVELIISEVVSRVADTIEKKKEIVAITPKASEITQINKENEKYFMELIDKAIAKKFK